MDLGRLYELAGDEQSALATWTAKMELAPSYYDPHRHLGNYYCGKGEAEKAFHELERALELAGGDPYVAADLGYCYATLGRPQDARSLLAQLDRSEDYVSPISRALIHVGLGNREDALQWLENGYDQRTFLIPTLNVDPRFEPLRSDPRFDDLLRRIGFPESRPPGQPPRRSALVLTRETMMASAPTSSAMFPRSCGVTVAARSHPAAST
jgi:hypothetical protein